MRYVIEKTECPKGVLRDLTAIGMIYFCKHCGAQLEGFFEVAGYDHKFVQRKSEIERQQKYNAKARAYENVRENAEKRMANLKSCPICGGAINRSPGYYIPRLQFSTSCFGNESNEKHLKYKLEQMTNQRKQAETESVKKQVEDFVIRNNPAAAVISSPAGSTKDSPEQLKNYILTLLRLENNIYSLQQHLSSLYYQRIVNDRAVNYETYGSIFESKVDLKNKQQAYEEALQYAEDAESYEPDISVDYPEEPEPPFLATPGLFNKKKVMAENEALTQKYQAALECYRLEVLRCDARYERLVAEDRSNYISRANKKAATAKEALDKARTKVEMQTSQSKNKLVPSKAAKALIEKEIVETEDLLKKTLSARNDLYAYDIIFIKYRNSVALSSFYEYLMTARCTSLEGANGAYNIYESEIRLNRISDQLDTVISSLEEIKQNQYMMYTELCSIHSSLDSLNTTMDQALTSIQGIEVKTKSMDEHLQHISRNTDVIAHNTAVTAYYSKLNAELTNALGFMAALK